MWEINDRSACYCLYDLDRLLQLLYKYIQMIKTLPCNDMCPNHWCPVSLIYLFYRYLNKHDKSAFLFHRMWWYHDCSIYTPYINHPWSCTEPWPQYRLYLDNFGRAWVRCSTYISKLSCCRTATWLYHYRWVDDVLFPMIEIVPCPLDKQIFFFWWLSENCTFIRERLRSRIAF